MDDMRLRPATELDLDYLCRLNKHLIEDEKSRNPMGIAELRSRMAGWLRGSMKIVVIEVDSEIAGYCVYKEVADEYFPDRIVVEVRQFFIRRELRGLGLGHVAFDKIAQDLFPTQCTISLSTLTTNPRGVAFWEKIGFKPYYVQYTREKA